VRRIVDGRVHRCFLNAGPMEEADNWVENYRSFWEDTLAALAKHVEEPTDEH
jgi:hypothetical protein